MIRHRAHIRKLARDSHDPIIHVLSFGAGVQTQWLLKYMTPFLKTVKHVIIFADTGWQRNARNIRICEKIHNSLV